MLEQEQHSQILDIVEKSQSGPANHMRNFLKLQKLYKLVDIQEFSTYFLDILKKVIQQNYQSQFVKNLLDFMGYFVGRIATLENGQEYSFEHPMLQSTIVGLSDQEYNNRTENEVLNICLFFSFIFNNVSNNAVVTNHLEDIVQNVLLRSLKDCRPEVRIQGIIALTRLQNPADENCPIIKEFIKCLGDPNYKVRQEIINRLAPNRLTLRASTEAVRDCHPKVRAATFRHLAQTGVKYLRITERQLVLLSGFSETHNQTKQVFLEYLLPKWLSSIENSFLKFLQLIKLDSSEHDIDQTEYLIKHLMQQFVRSHPIERLIEELPLNEDKLIPENEITSEQAVYWNTLYHYLHESEVSDDLTESLVPELKVFTDYIERLIELKYANSMEQWRILDFHHMLYQLFAIADKMNCEEEVGRRTLDQLIKKLFKNYSLQPRLMTKLFDISLKLNSHRIDDFTDEICGIITDIWQPFASAAPTKRQQLDRDCRMAAITVKINMLEDDKEQAIAQNNFLKAQSLKVEIEQKRLEQQQLKEEEPATQQVRITKSDPVTLCRCLDLLIALVRQLSEHTLPQALINLRDDFVIPLAGNGNTEVHCRVFEALAIFAIKDENMARENIQLLTVPVTFYRTTNVDVNMVVVSVSVITDLIRLHGTKFFSQDDSPTMRTLYVENQNLDVQNAFSIDSFISLLLDFLDLEDEKLRETASTALAKLILNDFPVNYTLVTRLVLKWYSKITQSSLQQIIGCLLNSFAAKSAANKEVIAKAVVPILTQLAEAPPTSPLAAVKMENPISFLCALTLQEKGVVHVHTELAKILLNELSKEEVGAAAVYYAKMLMQLQVPSNDSPAFREIVAKCDSIIAKEDVCPKGQLIQNKLTAFVAKLRKNLDNASNNVSAVNEEVRAEETSAVHPNDSGLEPLQKRRKRQSVSIEDVSSTDSENGLLNEGKEKQENSVPKRRKTEPLPRGNGELQLNNNLACTTPLRQLSSSSSNSDVIPPTQNVTRSSRRTSERLNKVKRAENIANASSMEQRLDSPLCTPDSKSSSSQESRRNNGIVNKESNTTKEDSMRRRLLVVPLSPVSESPSALNESRGIRRRESDQNSDSSDNERRNAKRRRKEKKNHDKDLVLHKQKSNQIIPLKELHIKVIRQSSIVSSSASTSNSSNSQINRGITRRTSKHWNQAKSITSSSSNSQSTSSNSQTDQIITRRTSKVMERANSITSSSSDSQSTSSNSQNDQRITRRTSKVMERAKSITSSSSDSQSTSSNSQNDQRITRRTSKVMEIAKSITSSSSNSSNSQTDQRITRRTSKVMERDSKVASGGVERSQVPSRATRSRKPLQVIV